MAVFEGVTRTHCTANTLCNVHMKAGRFYVRQRNRRLFALMMADLEAGKSVTVTMKDRTTLTLYGDDGIKYWMDDKTGEVRATKAWRTASFTPKYFHFDD